MPTTWLTTLAQDSLGNFELTPELDRELSRRALAARSDAAERDALLALLSTKLLRFCWRYRSWRLAPFTLEDVAQEGWLVFAALLEEWQPLPGPSGFGGYLLRVFPLRLSDHVRRMLGMQKDASVVVPWDERADPRADPHDWVRDVELAAWIAAVAAGLPPAEALLLRLRLGSDAPFRDHARRAGLSERTAWRRWHAIQEAARRGA